MKRRNFLTKAAIAVAGVNCSIGWNMPATFVNDRTQPQKKLTIRQDDVILFTGDSITDGSRDRTVNAANIPRALGSGYAVLTAARLFCDHPSLNVSVYNRGINGNTIENLLARWETDCLKLKPSIVSILAGVNDFNVSFAATGKGNTDRFRSEYRQLIGITKKSLPGVRLIIGEPYAIKGAREKIDKWYPDFIEYQKIAREIAREEDAWFIPYQDIYDKAAKNTPKQFYSRDGVHPTLAGIQLMSDAWYSIVKK